MSEPSIPVALGPHGNVVPIEEAERFKIDYYRCKECGEILNPRKGSVRTHYYAHKKGVLENKTCSLSSQADVEELVDELRTSDVEKDESDRRIRTYLGEAPGGRLRLFGILPAISWDELPPGTDVDVILDEMTVQTDGIKNPPIPRNFHPSEPEVFFELDPSATEYTIEIEGARLPGALTGRWSEQGLDDGDLFAGDQSRARRRRVDQQIKQGEWVYLVTTDVPETLPEIVQSRSLSSYTILAFPARTETQSLLDAYGEGLTTDQYGFDADMILPSAAHPTSEAPIEGHEKQPVLVSVTPAPEIDPTFEVVSIPHRKGDVTEIDPTGPGNPRFYKTEFPSQGSRRISVHQRNSNRHRLVHLHTVDEKTDIHHGEDTSFDPVGLQLDLGEEILLGPLSGQTRAVISDQALIASLPTRVSYVGPEGLSIEFEAKFRPGSPHGRIVRRSTTDVEQSIPEISQWALQGCEGVVFDFDGLGSASIIFDHSPESDVATPTKAQSTGGSR